jgi:hypothetical protein
MSLRSIRARLLFRRQPRFQFERGETGLSWRDLILPEKALRTTAGRGRGG